MKKPRVLVPGPSLAQMDPRIRGDDELNELPNLGLSNVSQLILAHSAAAGRVANAHNGNDCVMPQARYT